VAVLNADPRAIDLHETRRRRYRLASFISQTTAKEETLYLSGALAQLPKGI
jgi:hypothetical protein